MTAGAIDGLEGNEDWAKKKTGHIGPVWQLYGLLGSVYTGAGVSEWTSQFFAGTAAHLACLAVDQGIFASDTTFCTACHLDRPAASQLWPQCMVLSSSDFDMAM